MAAEIPNIKPDILIIVSISARDCSQDNVSRIFSGGEKYCNLIFITCGWIKTYLFWYNT